MIKLNEQVEELIDTHGLSEVLCAIANICAEKASHIRESYSDCTFAGNNLAELWAKAAYRVDSTAGSKAVYAVSPH